MYILILCLPVFGAFQSGFFGSLFGKKGSSCITILYMGITFVYSLSLLELILINPFNMLITGPCWIHFDLLFVSWNFYFDSLTIIMCFIVSFVSVLVHIYSYEYMDSDPHLPRFMAYLSFFTFFMLILISGNNMLQLFIGWEGVGLCSYLLINFWFTRIQANKAAIKAMIYNRLGDFGLIVGLLILFKLIYSINYGTIFNLCYKYSTIQLLIFTFNVTLLECASFCLFIGSIGKSAQLGLHAWLPDAMEGPTPVSALIHAATMVTAGVFLLTRMSFLFELTAYCLIIISIIGATTTLFAATIGLVQNDLKKIIAYSTCSQLGYMIFVCGLSNYNVGMFHLFNHAFFKSLLFLTAGAVIHSVQDEQDMRKLGGLKYLLPISYSSMLIGSLALIGFPFLSGFYSKEIILEITFSTYSNWGHYCYILGLLAALCTTFYSCRLLYLTFLTKPAGYKPVYIQIHESGSLIILVLSSLILCSIFFGYHFNYVFLGLGNTFWLSSIFYNSLYFLGFNYEFIPTFIKLMPLIGTILVIFLTYFCYCFIQPFLFKIKLSSIGKKSYYYLNKKWFFDKIFTNCISYSILIFSNILYLYTDRGFIELFGGFGIYNWLINIQFLFTNFTYYSFYHIFLLIFIFIVYFIINI